MRAKVSKILFTLLTAICFVCFVFAGPGVYAEGEEPEEIIAQAEEDFSVGLSTDKKEIYITGLTDTSKAYTAVIIPEVIDDKPVTKINANAFNGKITKATKIVIPDSVRVIEEGAFRNCNSMTDITIPVDVNAVDAFAGCGNTKNITYTKGQTGVMTDWEDSYDNGRHYGQSVANRSGNVENVVFKDGIKHIGNMAFTGRSNLISVTMPNNEVTIGARAFEGCAKLPSLDTSKVTNFGARAFLNCQVLKDIKINSKVTSLPDQVFYNCYAFNTVVIPDTVESIGSESFRNCSGIETISIPVDVTCVDSFNGCSNIKTINYTVGKTGVMVDATYDYSGFHYGYAVAMRTNALETVNFSDGITHIGDNMIRDRAKLTTVKFPNNEFSVGYAAFYQDTSLVIDGKDISNVTSIDQYAFQSCLGLKNLTFNSNVKEIPYHAFYGCTGIETLTIPDTVEKIGAETFRGCNGITEVSIPVDVTCEDSFYGCSAIKTINYTYGRTGVMVDATYDYSGFHYGYAIAMRTSALETVNFSDGITHIGNHMIRERAKLTTVKFPNNEFTVGYAAFYQDTALAIDNKDISNVTSIGEYAFQGCLGLSDLVINEKVTTIPNYAFKNCTQIEKVYIPDSVTDLGYEAFNGCASIIEMTLPVDVNYYDNTFMNYNNLTKITYTAGKTGISSNSTNHNNSYYNLEKRVSALNTVVFEEGVLNIHNGMFGTDISKSITDVKFPESITAVGSTAFIKGINANFYGYKDNEAEKYAATDDSIEYRYLEYPYVTPDSGVEMGLRSDIDFSAYVYTDIDTKSEEIEWSVKDNNSKKTVVEAGKLTVGDNEKSAEIKVCATYGKNTVEVPVKINRTVSIVEFDAGKGEASEEALATSDEKKLDSLPTAKYDYYTFDGWFTAEEDGDEVTTETVFEDDAIVYAHYSKTPVESIDIKAGAQPKSGVAFDTTVKSVSDNVDADSVNVSYMSDDKAVEGNAKCEVAYTAKVTFKLKNGYTNSDKTVLKINDSEVQLKKIDGGKYEGVVSFKATTHGETVLKGAKEATKTEEGYTGDKCCSICNEILERGKVIPKLTDDKKADDKKTEEKTTEKKPAETPAGDGVGTISADGKILTDTTGKKYYVAAKVTAAQLKANLMIADKKSGGKYKITKLTKNKKTKKVTGGTVTYMAPYNRNCTKATMPEFVKIAGVKFKVTALNKDAFKNCKKIKTVTIGKNITKIGANAFSGCAKLQSVSIKATGLKSIGGNAFKGISAKAKFKVPKKQYTKYSKMIKKAKAPKTAKISK